MTSQCIEIGCNGDSKTSPLQLRIARIGDRFQHSLVVRLQDKEVVVLTSIEGNSQDDFPPSPPFQEVSVETIDSKDVSLMTGMAGQSYWSASIEPDALNRSFRFDVAARLKAGTSQSDLGSCYDFPFDEELSSVVKVIEDEVSVQFEFQDPDSSGDWTLAVLPLDSQSTSSSGQSDLETSHGKVTWCQESKTVRIQPSSTDDGTTVRWLYEIALRTS